MVGAFAVLPRGRSDDTSTNPARAPAMSFSDLEAKAAGKRQIEVSEDSELQNRLLSNGGT